MFFEIVSFFFFQHLPILLRSVRLVVVVGSMPNISDGGMRIYIYISQCIEALGRSYLMAPHDKGCLDDVQARRLCETSNDPNDGFLMCMES